MTTTIVTGLLQPAQKNRFRFLLDNEDAISNQVVSLSLDIVNRTFVVTVQQPVEGQHIFDMIHRITAGKYKTTRVPFNIDILDSNCETMSRVQGYAKLIKHSMDLDYGSSKVVLHKLTFSYTEKIL